MSDEPTKPKPTKVWQLFSEPGTWTQGSYAKDSDGDVCSALSCGAVCWCVSGAIKLIHRPNWPEIANRLNDHLTKKHGMNLIIWNDYPGRTREEVVAELKEADV